MIIIRRGMVPPQPAAGIPSSGLVNQWNLSTGFVSSFGNGQTCTDSGPGGLTLIQQGGIVPGAGPDGQNVTDNNSASCYINTSAPHPSISWESQSFSLAMWVYINDNTTTQASNRRTYFNATYGGGLGVRVCNDSGVTPGAVAVGFSDAAIGTTVQSVPNATWTHIGH